MLIFEDQILQRINHGAFLFQSINDFLFMVNERAAIERKYAEKLESWYIKWTSTVSQGSEYGVVESIWQTVLKEAGRLSSIHYSMSSQLGTTAGGGIQKNLFEFKKQHYHKVPLLKEVREVKECREAFKSAQLPYKKALASIGKAKKKYAGVATLCLQLEAKLKDRGSQQVGSDNPSKPTTRTLSIVSSKLEAAKDQKEKAKAKYIEAINYFNDYVKDDYIRDMEAEFKRCQDVEHERITVILNSLHDFINAVNPLTHTNQQLITVYSEALSALAVVKPEANLTYFSKNFGPLMPTNFPQIEDVEMAAVASLQEPNSRKFSAMIEKAAAAGQWWQQLRHLQSEGHLRHGESPSSRREFMLRRCSNIESMCSSQGSDYQAKMKKSDRSFDSLLTAQHRRTLFSEMTDAEKESSSSSKEHYTMCNVYVRAVTNFVPTNATHLGITKGEVIYQLRGNDDGWCFGRIACKEGIYPSNTVQLLRLNMLAL